MTDTETMREALIKARNQFSYYASQHHAKMTHESTQKAIVNEGMVRMISAALGDDNESIAERVAIAIAGDRKPTTDDFFTVQRVLEALLNPTNQMFEDSGTMNDYTGDNADFDHAAWWNTMIQSAIEDADFIVTGAE